MAKKKKRQPVSPARRAFRAGYRTLVVCSSIVVALFCAYKLAIRPPAVAEVPVPIIPVVTPTDDPGTVDVDESKLPAPPKLERRPRTYTFLLAASDQVSGNSDTIMVATYDVPNQRVGVASIPRDTLVDRSYKGKRYHKINAAYAYGGIEELKRATTELLGIPIDYYVTVNVKAFVRLVDAVDGVDFHVPVHMSYDAPDQDLHIHFEPGLQHLTGKQALEVSRCRKNTDGLELGKENWMYDAYPDADIGRTQTQQKLLTAIAKKVLSLGSVTKIGEFVDIFAENVKTNMSTADMLYFVEPALGLDMKTGLATATFVGDGNVRYGKTTYCYQYDQQAALETINSLLNPYTTPVTAEMTKMLQVK